MEFRFGCQETNDKDGPLAAGFPSRTEAQKVTKRTKHRQPGSGAFGGNPLPLSSAAHEHPGKNHCHRALERPSGKAPEGWRTAMTQANV
jgi:hypothetical protein